MSSMTHGLLDFIDRTFASPAPIPLPPGQVARVLRGKAAAGHVTSRETLTNRAGFQRALKTQAASGKAFAIILINVDGMSRLNQQFGFETGDMVLEKFGNVLSRLVPHVCTVAHMFSDEFACLIPGAAAAHEAEALIVRILRALDEALIIEERSVRISVSMGVAHSPGLSAPCEDPLPAASRALSLAKQAGGRNWRSFDPSMLETDLELRQDLASALARKEIVPYYQPIVDLESGTMIGMEVLARWNHPRLGLLLPEQFIKPLEGEPALKGLTTSLLQQVAADAVSWPDGLIFSFNVAACQIRELSTYVLRPARNGGAFLAPHRIEIEIGESAMIDDLDATRELVLILQEHGARVALDNFGGDSANLHHICAVPFDRLKICRDFVRNAVHDTRTAICVRSIATMGRHLGIAVTAEGVAAEETAKLVQELGCRFAQGSFYGMPAPAHEVISMIARVQELLSARRQPGR
jgi:diguanylate cyclase (GGDEF)-like protein